MKLMLMMLVAAVALQGCAAHMAAQGQNGPDLKVVQKQQTRQDMERMLGLPVESLPGKNGEVTELYIVQSRTEPSTGRAVLHATADLFTFGLWEFVGGPAEAYQGRRQRVFVHYNEHDRVLSVVTDRQTGLAGLMDP